jgi:hypothetical protein
MLPPTALVLRRRVLRRHRPSGTVVRTSVSLESEIVMADQIVITEKSSQAKDVRGAVGALLGASRV